MKKIILASALAFAGLSFVACDSDDNTGGDEQSLMVGTWEAKEYSYIRPDNQQEYTHDFSTITGTCEVDILTINENNSAVLSTETKNAEDICEENLINGEWNEETVTIEGEEVPRIVVESTENTLKLKYPYMYMMGGAEITVTYIKQ